MFFIYLHAQTIINTLVYLSYTKRKPKKKKNFKFFFKKKKKKIKSKIICCSEFFLAWNERELSNVISRINFIVGHNQAEQIWNFFERKCKPCFSGLCKKLKDSLFVFLPINLNVTIDPSSIHFNVRLPAHHKTYQKSNPTLNPSRPVPPLETTVYIDLRKQGKIFMEQENSNIRSTHLNVRLTAPH